MTTSRTVDLVIVGAGVTGALLAEAATAVGLSTVILDRRGPAAGSTAASTALLQFEIDKPLIHLADEIGFERASRAWRCSYQAVQDLGELVRRLGLRCAFRRRSALYLAGNTLSPSALAEEGRWRRSIGLPSDYVNRAKLRDHIGIEGGAALHSSDAADVDPVRLAHGLLRRAIDRGAKLHYPVQLREFSAAGRGASMVTTDDFELRSKSLVFATGYEVAKGIPLDGHKRSSTWVFATRRQPEKLRALGKFMVWEAADPYLYIRTTMDGRLVAGGEDEDLDDETARDKLLTAKTQALRAKIDRLLPWLDTAAEFSWAGTFGESDTGLPTIGPIPGMPNCYAVLGYGGNGLTFAFLAAGVIKDFLCGRPKASAELFAFKG